MNITDQEICEKMVEVKDDNDIHSIANNTDLKRPEQKTQTQHEQWCKN